MTIKVGASGFPACTSLDSILLTGGTSWRNDCQYAMGATRSASITSATLTEVLNIAQAGFLTFSAITSGGTVASHKIRIVLDGVEVLNEASGAGFGTNKAYAQVGSFSNSVSVATEGLIRFNESLVVEIAGDGTTAAQYLYKRVLTE